MKLEACIETLPEAIVAAEYHFNRVELCSALDLGGLTPSSALTSACAEHIEVHAMVRSRAGGFIYSDLEIGLMLSEIEELKKAKAAGVVFGCLTPNHAIELNQTKALTQKAKALGLMVTFHRAFDFVEDQPLALKQLTELGVDRVLTSGGAPTAIQGIENIKELVKLGKSQIEIMAGSGVNAQCANELKLTGVDALHFTIKQKSNSEAMEGMGFKYSPNIAKITGVKNALE